MKILYVTLIAVSFTFLGQAQTILNNGIATTPSTKDLMLRTILTNSATNRPFVIVNATGTNQGFIGLGTTANTAITERLTVSGNILATGNLATNGGIINTVSSFMTFQTNGSPRLTIQSSNGNIGIGTPTPQYALDVNGVINAANILINGVPVSGGGGGSGSTQWINTGNSSVYFGTNTVGNVGLGTSSPDFRLTVNGKIKCEELQVVVDVPADYVFEKGYKLMPLPNLEAFIAKNKHLPNIPSANELTANGWQVGEMNNKLLEKIEELTLYLIALQKETEALKQKISELEK